MRGVAEFGENLGGLAERAGEAEVEAGGGRVNASPVR